MVEDNALHDGSGASGLAGAIELVYGQNFLQGHLEQLCHSLRFKPISNVLDDRLYHDARMCLKRGLTADGIFPFLHEIEACLVHDLL